MGDDGIIASDSEDERVERTAKGKGKRDAESMSKAEHKVKAAAMGESEEEKHVSEEKGDVETEATRKPREAPAKKVKKDKSAA